jgi:hypothetical protein
VATLPEDDEFAQGLQAYFATAGRPDNRPFTQLLFENGLQQPDGIETELGGAIGELRRNLWPGTSSSAPYAQASLPWPGGR